MTAKSLAFFQFNRSWVPRLPDTLNCTYLCSEWQPWPRHKCHAQKLISAWTILLESLSPTTPSGRLNCFTRATEMDPHHSLAWSGLADAYATDPISGGAIPLEIWPKGREAAEHRIQAAAELAETQTSRGRTRSVRGYILARPREPKKRKMS